MLLQELSVRPNFNRLGILAFTYVRSCSCLKAAQHIGFGKLLHPRFPNIYVVHTFFLAVTIPRSLVASVYAHSDTVAGQDLQTLWSPRVAACGPVVRGLSCGI